MEPKLKERIVGATVIVALGIIIIPWLLDGPAHSPRPVEQAIELPRIEQPGRTYTIPLDPGAGPPVQVETGNDPQPVPLRSGAGAVQRLPAEEPATPIVRIERPAPAASQPAQPAPRPAPADAQRAAQPAPSTIAPAPAAAAATGPWTVQVGSFSQADNAQALQRRLAGQGFDAFVSRVATDAGTMHRVRVGPVPEREAADRLLSRVSAAGHSGARVVRAED
jgi:DedD protein